MSLAISRVLTNLRTTGVTCVKPRELANVPCASFNDARLVLETSTDSLSQYDLRQTLIDAVRNPEKTTNPPNLCYRLTDLPQGTGLESLSRVKINAKFFGETFEWSPETAIIKMDNWFFVRGYSRGVDLPPFLDESLNCGFANVNLHSHPTKNKRTYVPSAPDIVTALRCGSLSGIIAAKGIMFFDVMSIIPPSKWFFCSVFSTEKFGMDIESENENRIYEELKKIQTEDQEERIAQIIAFFKASFNMILKLVRWEQFDLNRLNSFQSPGILDRLNSKNPTERCVGLFHAANLLREQAIGKETLEAFKSDPNETVRLVANGLLQSIDQVS